MCELFLLQSVVLYSTVVVVKYTPEDMKCVIDPTTRTRRASVRRRRTRERRGEGSRLNA